MEATEFLQTIRVQIRREIYEDLIRYMKAQIATGEVGEGPSLRGKSTTEAAEMLLKEVGRPLPTREIGQILLSRGVQTKSRNFTASLYSTLSQAKSRFRRTKDGEWELRK